MKDIRLDKYLADMSVGTRKQVKQYIRAGIVCVNGVTVSIPDAHIHPDDRVTVDGRDIVYEEYVYYMLNKPAGVLSASNDKRQKTVLDLIEDNPRKDLFPVGRLDKDTEGLLLICNDGQLAHRLLSPARHVSKVYTALVRGKIGPQHIRLFNEGLRIDDEWTAAPAKLQIISTQSAESFSTRDAEKVYAAFEKIPEAVLRNLMRSYEGRFDVSEVLITIYEGKFHQIKRMFNAVGSEVLYLKRLSMGCLDLDNSLEPGQYRRLTSDEIAELKKM